MYNAEAAFTASATTEQERAIGVASFEASLGKCDQYLEDQLLIVCQAFFLLFMGVLVSMYLICSLRTNLVFFGMFLFLEAAVLLLTGAYWKAAQGDVVTFQKLEVVCTSFTRVVDVLSHPGPRLPAHSCLQYASLVSIFFSRSFLNLSSSLFNSLLVT